MSAQIIGIGRQFRQNFLLSDRTGDIPWRVEENVVYRRLQFWCLLIEFADDDAGGKYRTVIAEQLKTSDRRIHHHTVRRNVPWQPAQPLQVDCQLSRTPFGGGTTSFLHEFGDFSVSRMRLVTGVRYRTVFHVSPTHRCIFDRGWGESFDQLCRVRGGNRSIEQTDYVDWFGGKVLIIHALLD